MPPFLGTSTGFINNYVLDKDVRYPFTLTFSKDGYRDYSIIIERLNELFTGVITLEDYEPPIYYHQSLQVEVTQSDVTGTVTQSHLLGVVTQSNVQGVVGINKIQGEVSEVDISG